MSTLTSLDLEQGFGGHLGIEIDEIQPTRVTGHMVVRREHLNAAAQTHGAILMGLADVVAAHATIMSLPANCSTTTLESKTNFLRASGPGTIWAESVPLHQGRSTMVWQTTIRDEAGQKLAVTLQTQLILDQPRAATVSLGASSNVPEGPAASSETPPVSPVVGTSTADQRKAKILAAAFAVISRKGFASASMREIAQEAGMPVPTMYQYVRSKDELLEGIFDGYLSQVQASMQLSGLAASGVQEKLKAAISTNIAEFDRFQSQIRLMNRETRSVGPEARERIKRHVLSYIGLFRDLIQEGIDTRQFRAVNVDVYANFIAMLCELWPLRVWAVGHHGVNVIRDCVIDIVLNALQPQKGLER